MKIWIDADACPTVIKELLFRAAQRTHTRVTLVANNGVTTPRSDLFDSIVVPTTPDAADHRIVERMATGDLVITADIPLAAAVVEQGGTALNPRGQHYTAQTIGEALATRDLMTDLRSAGQLSGKEAGGPAGLGPKDKQAFANQLDRLLTRAARQRQRP